MNTSPQTPHARIFAWIILGTAFIWLFSSSIAPNLWPKNFSIVRAGSVYRSGELTPAATKKLADNYNIKTIIDLGAHKPDSHEDQLAQKTADSLHITRFLMPLEGDATGNVNWYVRALEIMTDKSRQPVLIHCAAGAERTGAAIALYRYIIQNQPLDQAYNETLRFGHSSTRNPKLKLVLDEWADKIKLAYQNNTLIPSAEPVPTIDQLEHQNRPPTR